MTTSPKGPLEGIEYLPDYLPVIDISKEPHDGSHGLFCPECMDIIRWSEKEARRG